MSDAATETELKFLLTPEAAARAKAGPLGGAGEEALVSVYFDTPGLALRRAGASLRLRKQGGGWVQTLKVGEPGALTRFEDERSAPSGTLDLGLFEPASLKRAASGSIRGIRPLFETRIHRRTAALGGGAVRVEMALDVGEIRAGQAKEAVAELEFELKAGSPKDLFTAARPFVEDGGARLSLASKAERGYRLAGRSRPAAVRFQTPGLDFDAPAAAGFQALCFAALHQFLGNVEVLRRRSSAEAVHQARVSLRRLKTFISAFRALVQDPDAGRIASILDRLAAAFEDARSLDVLQSGIFRPFAAHEPGAAAFGQALRQARRRAHDAVRSAVKSEALQRDVFDLCEWIVSGPWTERAPSRGRGETLKAVARRLLDHRWKALGRRADALDWSDAAGRHKLRIQAKKLRYLCEAFLPPKRSRSALERLEWVQDALGRLNDMAVAPAAARLALKGVEPEAAFAAGLLVGRGRKGSRGLVKEARRTVKALRNPGRPWRRTGRP